MKYPIPILLFLFTFFSPIFSLAAELSGMVIDDRGNPLSAAVVVLVYPDGNRYVTQSDREGQFLFQSVPPGQATCFIELDGDHQPIHPRCGEFQVEIEEHHEKRPQLHPPSSFFFQLSKEPQAVIIEFGKPTRPKPGGKQEPIVLKRTGQSKTNLSIDFVDGAVASLNPTAIEIIGRWTLPFHADLGIQAVAAKPAAQIQESLLRFDLQPIKDGQVKIRVETMPSEFVPFGLIGEFSLIFDSIPQGELGPIHFCTQSLTVFSNDSVVWKEHDQIWQGTFLDASELEAPLKDTVPAHR